MGLVSRRRSGQKCPGGQAYFRWAIDLPADAKVRTAGLVLTADDRFTLYVNGKPAGKSREDNEGWRSPLVVDLSTLLGPGRNLIAIEAVNIAGPAGVVARCNVELQSGARIEQTSDASWAASQQSAAGWENPAFDDSHWAKAKVLGPMGIGPWGHVLVAGQRAWAQQAPSPMFRKVFEVKKPLARARPHLRPRLLRIAAQRRQGGRSRARPDFTRYDKRVLYATYDVTGQMVQGRTPSV